MIDTTLIIIGGLAAILVIFAGWIVRLEIRLRRLVRGKNAMSLEETIGKIIRDVQALKEYGKNSSLYLQEIENRMQKSIQAVETVRYNPFQGTGEGGNQSFATAFVNQLGDGVVISSLHARERVSVFAKPVKEFASEHELTSEEQHVIDRARSLYPKSGR